MAAQPIDRREFLIGAGASGLVAFLALHDLSRLQRAQAARPDSLLGFAGIAAVPPRDQVVVPPGYDWEVLIAWGDPLHATAPEFSLGASAADQLLQFGDHNDGMHFFAIDAEHALLVVNNENTDKRLHDDVAKDQAAIGISVLGLRHVDGRWVFERANARNRRVHLHTPIAFSGPAAGHPLLETGDAPRGTLGNCAGGHTPWGSFLSCEENFNWYFGATDLPEPSAQLRRYGFPPAAGDQHRWYEKDRRFDLQANPHECHRFGWVVEVDPFDPTSTPRKLTALGRFKHENAAVVVASDGRLVVYMGDDEKGEYLYRYVSRDRFDPSRPQAARALLDEGTLYVAQLADGDHRGRWIELTLGRNGLGPEHPRTPFREQAEIQVFTRLAGDVVGATLMDRPEWIAVHPHEPVVYCTMTNNSQRGVDPRQPIDAANPRAENVYGHILRWRPDHGDHCAEGFDWDIFLLAGNPLVHARGDARAGSAQLDASNVFNSPDGLAFDDAGRLWIQTDGDFSNRGDFAGMGNNQMLVADPASGELRRFLTGPNGCEITGIAFAPDQRTLFVGIQHPGEKSESHFPQGGDAPARSSVIRITRRDGGVIGG